ncbi:hypothetical protein N7478_006677 [Penicillium angulare]|uniref:uncharacterized protein n=1 Tax=Penicillium angulare TaxID=116970 RepID=UPI0025404259|nr:uncharacterized protein N7478_006677 [Penicillium angulare]KAJ5281305.1 hypothetical protein N7478_006677 [Penicillium angulare]
MGNLCSRASNDPDTFSGPGRVVGTTPSNPTPRASVPQNSNWKSTPGRTLGENSPTKSQPQTQGRAGPGTDEARSNAAIAAQKRADTASSTSNKGKLGSRLAADKRKTQDQILNEVSLDERAARNADQAAEARQWS